MKKIKIFLISTIFMVLCVHAQTPINKNLFGVNAWWLDFEELNATSFASNSYFHQKIDAVAASGCKVVRIGGIALNLFPLYNFNATTYSVTPSQRLTDLINLIRSKGMEPIIEVGYNPICSSAPLSSTLTMSQQASIAASLVKYLNHPQTGVYKDRRIEYFVISNEPDLQFSSCSPPSGGLSYTAQTSAATIAAYTRTFATLMKAEDPNILIIGPELAKFGSDNGQDSNGDFYNPSNKIMQDLTANPTSSPSTSIMGKIGGTGVAANEYFIDILSFHHYAISYYNSNSGHIIDEPALRNDGLAKTLKNSASQRKGLVDMISTSGRSAQDIQIACTEFNIDLQNSLDISTNYTTVVNDFDSRSFLAGQWMVETFAEAMKSNNGSGLGWVEMMNLWSVQEAGCSGHDAFGYIANCTVNSVSTPSLSMYHHYGMMANQFKGSFFTSTLTVSSATVNDIKAYAAKSGDRIAVIIINQSSNDRNFAVKLNGIATHTDLAISFAIPGVTSTATTYTTDGTSADKLKLDAHSTVLLIYTCVGKPHQRRDYKKSMVLTNVAATPTSVSLGTPLMGITGLPAQLNQGVPTVVTLGPSGYTINWLGSTCGPVTSTNQGLTVTFQPCENTQQTQTYSYTATDPDGCTVTENITLETGLAVSGLNASVRKLDATCGLSDGTATVFVGTNQLSSTCCKWDGGPNTSSVTTGLSPGFHTVTVTYGSTYGSYFYVGIKDKPIVNAGNDFYCANYGTASLSVFPDLSGSGYTYAWYKGTNTVSCGTSPTLAVTHWGNTNYRVIVNTNATNTIYPCTNEDNVMVTAYGSFQKKSDAVYGGPCPPPLARPGGTEIDSLTANTVINSDQYIDRIIIVPSGIKLEISECELTMSGVAKIQVSDGGTLTVRQAFIHPCGDLQWPGVVIKSLTGLVTFTGSILDNGQIRGFGSRGVKIENCGFVKSDTAINLFQSQGFTIKNNTFDEVDVAVSTVGSSTITPGSSISQNYFSEVLTGISFKNDNHANTFVRCNIFENYTNFAIHSVNSTLGNQGNSGTGTGNVFNSNSSEINHQFSHNGNSITYYCDPSHSFTLQAVDYSVSTSTAQADATCPDLEFNRASEPVSTLSQIAAANNKIEARAFPNPFSNNLTVLYSLPATAKKATLKIYEGGSGKELFEMNLNTTESNIRLDGLSLAMGLYICVINTDDGKTAHFKIVKVE